MVRKTIVVGLFLVGAALGQCPIRYTEVRPKVIQGNDYLFTLKAVNTTDKTITGLKFGLVLMDDTNDPHEVPANGTSDRAMKPGKEVWHGWKTNGAQELWGSHKKDGAGAVYLVKAIFEDGSEWQDDGTRGCLAVGPMKVK